MEDKVLLLISEEFGYKEWYAILTRAEYAQLEQDWATIQGLTCLVPVTLLIPQAHQWPWLPEHAKYENLVGVTVQTCHVHESDDSSLGTLEFTIPEQKTFEFKGVEYTRSMLADVSKEHLRAEADFILDRCLHEPGYMAKTELPGAYRPPDALFELSPKETR